MPSLVILGAGTAGTRVANTMRQRLGPDWRVLVVDPATEHLYQPGLVFLPFGARIEHRLERPRASTLRPGVEWHPRAVARVVPDEKSIVFESGGRVGYDLLVIATGAHIRPEETEGVVGPEWHSSIFDFYTLDGALALRDALADFRGGRLVVNVVEMPIKCPVAPLEFAFLADDFHRRRGTRDDVEIVYVTPLDGAFTRPIASGYLGSLLDEKGIVVETEFATSEVNADRRELRSYDDRVIAYDLLVTVPTHMGAAFVDASGLGNELGFVPTHPTTLQSKSFEDIFVVGDATDLPTSKAGSVAHFESEALVANLERAAAGRSLVEGFDGHANCFIETGDDKGVLVDFNYEVEPLPGRYPWPVVGPFSLLEETRVNHYGKLAFEWIYWNALIPGRPLPISDRLSMRGKHDPTPSRPVSEEEERHAHT